MLVLLRMENFNYTLINSKTALEYGLDSNYAEDTNSWGMGEYLRAPLMHGGNIKLNERLERLGTGIFISNIHYLNWSDNLGGRITGLTRYACYWVEDGKMIAPIKTMRFDDSFYNFFGSNLDSQTNAPTDLTPFRHMLASDPSVLKNFMCKS